MFIGCLTEVTEVAESGPTCKLPLDCESSFFPGVFPKCVDSADIYELNNGMSEVVYICEPSPPGPSTLSPGFLSSFSILVFANFTR